MITVSNRQNTDSSGHSAPTASCCSCHLLLVMGPHSWRWGVNIGPDEMLYYTLVHFSLLQCGVACCFFVAFVCLGFCSEKTARLCILKHTTHTHIYIYIHIWYNYACLRVILRPGKWRKTQRWFLWKEHVQISRNQPRALGKPGISTFWYRTVPFTWVKHAKPWTVAKWM